MKSVIFLVVLLFAGPALANHPEDRLDEAVAEKEPAFEATDVRRPPELDVVEMRGQDTNTVITTAHSNESGQHTMSRDGVQVADTDGFHDYGVLWTKDEIVWYFDDTEIARADTPADMHEPMYMLVNLAVGGMADTPNDDFADGSEMKIDHIEAYSLTSDWDI